MPSPPDRTGVSGRRRTTQDNVDRQKPMQVLTNLRGNAVKFNKSNRSVRISAELDGGRGLLIRVRDTGIGMRSDDIPVAPAPFRQADARLACSYEGTGLGLPVSRSLVERHGGMLEIEGTPDIGTQVTVRLPAGRTVRADADSAALCA